jgi:HK97 family phage prohead protease
MTAEHIEVLPTRAVERMYTIEDLTVRQDGTGRVVEAYAAVFDDPTEIMDIDGHYHETVSRTAFDRTLQHKGVAGFTVLFNHGRTVDGEPYPAASMPIGVPLEIEPDGKGLFTATRYLDNPLADWTLDAIKQGAIKAQSFSGRFTKSQKVAPAKRGDLPLIRRNEVDMREYGPAVFAAYTSAAILGTRAEQFMRQLLATPPDRRLEWLTQFEGLATPLIADPVGALQGTPPPEPGEGPASSTDDPPARHSARSLSAASRAKAWRITHGVE